LHAEEVNYWKTSRSGVETWIERIVKEIEEAGGEFLTDAFASRDGKAAFLVEFTLGEDHFKIMWPVLTPAEDGRTAQKAAKVQAVTALYHEVKNNCVKAKFMGALQAFFPYYVLPDGRTASETSIPELTAGIPELLKMSTAPQLSGPEENNDDNIIDIS
jgi:hypothetical protein